MATSGFGRVGIGLWIAGAAVAAAAQDVEFRWSSGYRRGEPHVGLVAVRPPADGQPAPVAIDRLAILTRPITPGLPVEIRVVEPADFDALGMRGSNPTTFERRGAGGSTDAYGRFGAVFGAVRPGRITVQIVWGPPSSRRVIATTLACEVAVDGASGLDWPQDPLPDVDPDRLVAEPGRFASALLAARSPTRLRERDQRLQSLREHYVRHPEHVAAYIDAYARLTEASARDLWIVLAGRIPGDACRTWLQHLALDRAQPIDQRIAAVLSLAQDGELPKPRTVSPAYALPADAAEVDVLSHRTDNARAHASTIDTLITLLHDDESPSTLHHVVALPACAVLEDGDPPTSRAELVQRTARALEHRCLRADPGSALERRIAESLSCWLRPGAATSSRLQGPELLAEKLLGTAFDERHDLRSRTAAIRAYARIARRATPMLLHLARDSADAEVREAAATALDPTEEDRDLVARFILERVLAEYPPRLAGVEQFTNRCLLFTASRIGPPGLAVLREAAEKSPDRELRELAAQYVARAPK